MIRWGDSADRQGCAASLSLKGRSITHAPSAKLHLTLLAEGFWYVQPATGILGLPAVGARSPQTRRFISNRVWCKKPKKDVGPSVWKKDDGKET